MPDNRILDKMLDRLYASLARGPSLNCRPHSSRQRVDVTALAALGDLAPDDVVRGLFDGARSLRARVPMPETLVREAARGWGADGVVEEAPPKTDAEQAAEKAWRAQQSLLTKLRHLSEDARTYERDTGVHALSIGYPLLSLPPGTTGGGTRRILAPVAFVPASLEVSIAGKPGLRIACRGAGVDLVTPNPALMAWLERETGQPLPELFEDEEGEEPWREIAELVRVVTERLELAADLPEPLALQPIPRAEDLGTRPGLLSCAVLGLFPASNQGLLRDTREMIGAESLDGPVVSFLDVDVALDAPPADVPEPGEGVEHGPRRFADERMVARADPFQARAVARARSSTGLVVHGPPGTGKSQTITNIIGDHLARGERVLFVCDKRTALDVVNNRLAHIGLGRLAAIVHDPRRDQRDLYMTVRGHLEELAELQTNEKAEAAIRRADKELQQIHDELTAAHAALMAPRDQGVSFHALVGEWLSIDAPHLDLEQPVAAATLDAHDRDLRVLLERAAKIGYAHNPWTTAVGCPLGDYLARPVEEVRRALASVAENARVADRERDERIPAFDATEPLDAQVARRTELREKLPAARAAPEDVRTRAAEAQDWGEILADADLSALDTPLDKDLALGGVPAHLNRDLGVLERYLEAMGRWWSFLAFGPKREARDVLREHGLNVTPDAAQRLHTFLLGVRARLHLSDAVGRLRGAPVEGLLPDDAIRDAFIAYTRVHAVLGGELHDRVVRALVDDATAVELDEGLARSPARAAALGELESSLEKTGLFAAEWRARFAAYAREGREAAPTIAQLQERFDSLEDVMRTRDERARLPEDLRGAVDTTLQAAFDAETGHRALRRQVLAGEIRRRLQADGALQQLDEQRVEHNLKRLRELEARKRERVREAILHRWVERQRERLLAGTRTRLNSEGANLRRRLLVRGKRALRLRQVVAAGEAREDGDVDPLFDMCPVWMASPETVAQVFARRPLFDVVVFDEASQCRLEEALPVLTRAHRAVIAGDPKQLPPTRFFEAAIASSEDEEMETDQDLFEAQQGEVEDLLCAALNLQVDEAYLDVHYRSRNADLIGFSNDNFYRSRLQAIPGHPSRRAETPPVRLVRADGLYDDRRNRVEAERVVDIVDTLLQRDEPPSIGIACFNLRQRDLILDVLDERAAADEPFAGRLARARARVGEGTFEGLFVKNLESVQGDERDHIVISTTYGPNREGKFYRRFGPLGRAGGGRRLNVLVTRAREEVHLVTSIPRESYARAEDVPDGLHPNGSWLLFAYLRYAEDLARAYAADDEETMPGFVARDIPPVSDFAQGLGRRLAAEQGVHCDAHWGNAGFCVDVALRPDGGATLGLLCDFARYPHAPDPIEWEVFRGGILEAVGWELNRVWTPDYFRDPERLVNRITDSANA